MLLRRLILDTASKTAGVGKLEETLKWDEPAYLTAQSGSGSTIRIAGIRSDSSGYAMHFNCQSSLIQTFRTMFPEKLRYQANRSILFHAGDRIPVKELGTCISIALTYHRNKKPRRLPKVGRF